MEQQITAVFDAKGVAGFKIRWKFDEMFAVMIAEDYDKNQNGLLEDDEVAVVKDEAFSYISKFSYFVFIKIDGKPFDVKFVRDFNAVLDNGKLTYAFLIPCHVSAMSDFKKIIVAAYDPTYHSAIYFDQKKPLLLENNEKYEVKKYVQRDESTSIYFDMVNPWALFLDFRAIKWYYIYNISYWSKKYFEFVYLAESKKAWHLNYKNLLEIWN